MSSFTESIGARAFHGIADEQRARYALGAVAFALATAVSAQIAVRLPWTPVPITLQPLLVVLAGVVLGSRLGAISIAGYVVVGALGAPVFSNGGAGLPWLFGPTGGYLLAAPLAAFVTGAVTGRERSAMRLLGGLVLGVATMYVGGVAQLMGLAGAGVREALALGVLPFLVGDATKIAVAFFATVAVRAARQRS